jgi:TonB family protein
MTPMLVVALLLTLAPAPAAFQARDTPPPAIENARRERELRAAIAAGTAPKETYLALSALMTRQNRFDEALEALRGAASLEPTAAEPQHRIALFLGERVRGQYPIDLAKKRSYLRQGIEAEDRALALQPLFQEAITYRAELVRLQASDDASVGPFAGFPEPFEQAAARLQPVRVGGNIRTPTKVKDARPVYPPIAQSARVQGVVIIEALIDESGNIANGRVLRSIPLLDMAAMDAVSRWQFTPTELNGRAVAVIMTVTVNFSLQ